MMVGDKIEYEVIDGNWLACGRCGATVWFSYMTIHTAWHEGPVEEVVENPVEEDA